MRDIEVTRSAPPATEAAAAQATVASHVAPPHPVSAAATARAGDDALKRLLDLAVAVTAVLLLWPVLLIIAIAIKVDSAGPAIFKQTRLGRGGKEFTFYKFRTMVDGNDPAIHKEYVTKLMSDCSDELKGENGSFKIEADPRVTRVGRLLRRSSLDELPQLFNVLRGDMSMVGPRPCLAYEAEMYGDRERRRLEVLPGLTGLWQVSGRCETTFEEMIDLDVSYVDSRTCGMDVKIMCRTFGVIFDRKGAW